jgi:hypothetical protein
LKKLALVESLEEAFERHREIVERGTEDPMWPDGVNANVVRSQIIFYRNQLKELCRKQRCRMPAVVRRKIPRPLFPTFMAPNSRAGADYFPSMKKGA